MNKKKSILIWVQVSCTQGSLRGDCVQLLKDIGTTHHKEFNLTRAWAFLSMLVWIKEFNIGRFVLRETYSMLPIKITSVKLVFHPLGKGLFVRVNREVLLPYRLNLRALIGV